MNKQREAFESLYDYKNLDDRQKIIVDGSCYKTFCDGWQAAQADKLDFARKVGNLSFQSGFAAAYHKDSISLEAIIAKVEQEQ